MIIAESAPCSRVSGNSEPDDVHHYYQEQDYQYLADTHIAIKNLHRVKYVFFVGLTQFIV